MKPWVNIKQAALRYDVDEQVLLSWAEVNEITHTRVGDSIVLEEESLESYMESTKTLALMETNLTKLMEQREAILARELECYDEWSLMARLKNDAAPLHRLVIELLSPLIENSKEAWLFRHISLEHDARWVAEHSFMNYEQALAEYSEIIRHLSGMNLVIANSDEVLRLRKRCQENEELLLSQEKQLKIWERFERRTSKQLARKEKEIDALSATIDLLVGKMSDRESKHSRKILVDGACQSIRASMKESFHELFREAVHELTLKERLRLIILFLH